MSWKNKVDTILKYILFTIGAISAATVLYAAILVFKSPPVHIIQPQTLAIAPRTWTQTLTEQLPVAGATKENLIQVSKESLPLEMLLGPNADVYLFFKEHNIVAKNVISVPYTNFQSVEMRPALCHQKPFENHRENWKKLNNNANGSFYFEVSAPLQCFELRIASISPKSIQVELFDSLAALHTVTNFENSAIQIPYYTFIAAILIAASIAWAITRDPILPMYLSYILTVWVFSFFMDGNAYVFFEGIKISVAGSVITYSSMFAVAMVSWMWMKILGKQPLFVITFWSTFLIGVIGIAPSTDLVVRIANIIGFIAGAMMITGALLKAKHSFADKKTRNNAILLFFGVLVFNSSACLWVLQHEAIIESNLFTRHCIKAGFIVESFFFMWAISSAYRQKQEKAKLALEVEKNQYYTAALKFVPRFLLDLLGKDDIRNIDFGSTVSLIGTIVCIDIKAFTVWSENRLPQEIISKTNEAWTSLIPHIHSCNGSVVSFTGDGLIILFPKNPLDALTFIVCTMERKKNDEAFIPDFEFGMGVHYGSIILGTVGQSSQMHITVLSDIVNTAARIEGVTRDTKSMCAASGAFIRACGIGKSSTLQIKPTGHRTNSDSIFLGVGMCYLGARMFKGKSIAIELFDIAIVQNAVEFKQIVDFINGSENLKRGIEYRNEFDCLLTAVEKQNPILVHYLKHAAKTELKLAEAQSAEAA